MKSYKCDALVTGIPAYSSISRSLKLILEHDAEKQGIDFKFNYDFADSHFEAWEMAKTSHHDVYIIDGELNRETHRGRHLSEMLKELNPGTPIIGMSMDHMDGLARSYFDFSIFTGICPDSDIKRILRELKLLPGEVL